MITIMMCVASQLLYVMKALGLWSANQIHIYMEIIMANFQWHKNSYFKAFMVLS